MRKLHDKELHDFYSLPSIVRIIKLRKMRWEGRTWGRLLIGNLEGKRPLGRPRCVGG
jgi:hypothetical protein